MEYQKLNEDHMLELKQKALEQREDWLSAAQEAAAADEKEKGSGGVLRRRSVYFYTQQAP